MPNQMDEHTITALVAEYRGAQAHINGASARSWQSAGIVLAGAIAGMVYLAIADVSSLAATIATTLISLGVIGILVLEWTIIQREVFFQELCMQRMREIEEALGLKRVIYVNVLDEWEKRENNRYWKSFSEQEKQHIENWYTDEKGNGAPGPRTRKATYIIICVLIVLWILLIAWKWSLYAGIVAI